MPIRNLKSGTRECPIQKSAFFHKVKENKGLRGDVRLHVAQAILKFNAEIVEKGHFWMDTG